MEKNIFWWTEARHVLAALALFIGGKPVIAALLGSVVVGGIDIIQLGLTIVWIISGLVSAYLAYQWVQHKQMVFGGKSKVDEAAFAIAVVSGLNLGIAGLLGFNIGMTIANGYVFFIIAGLAYLWAAYHLYTRFNANGQKFF